MTEINNVRIDNLDVKIYNTRQTLGNGAAQDAKDRILKLQSVKSELNMIFAAAPSQIEFLTELSKMEGIDWKRINAYHMDEYIGLKEGDARSFRSFLDRYIFKAVDFKSVNYIKAYKSDIPAECERYASLLRRNPADIVCMGVGENGHIAFNDPHAADFYDPMLVKAVKLDMKCRNQQVHDKCFLNIDEVPERAITLTVPAMMSASYVFCIVPGATKKAAVKEMLEGPVEESCPASIIRKHGNAILYLDMESGSLLTKQTLNNS